MQYINLTPHPIKLNNGGIYPPSGTVASVGVTFTEIEGGSCRQIYGEVENLPPFKLNVYYIVTAMVFDSLKDEQCYNVVTPATNHPDCVRSESGQVISVPCFITKH